MNHNMFAFNRDSKIILYGAASIGSIMKQYLELTGYSIEGFLDKRGYEISDYLGKPVWMIDKIPSELNKLDNLVIIVAVKNVYEHSGIVANLVSKGYHNLIYKPYEILSNTADENQEKINAQYECIMLQSLVDRDYIVPKTYKKVSHKLVDWALISKEGKFLTAYIPIEFIYTNNYPRNSEMYKWGNLNIAAFFTHLQYFKFLSGDQLCSYEDYLKEYCIFTAKLNGHIEITKGWKENVLKNRAIIYEQMNLFLQIDKDFFCRNAPEAVWNEEEGYFNLTSGKHRCSFLVSRRFRFIPLKISWNDYCRYCNEEIADKVVKNMNVEKIISPIANPYFYKVPHMCRELYYNLLEHYSLRFAKELYMQFGNADFSRMNIMFMLNDSGMLARHFARMGSYVTLTETEENPLLDALLHTEDKRIVLYKNNAKNFDIVFWDTRVYPVKWEEFRNIKASMYIILAVEDQLAQLKDSFDSLTVVFRSLSEMGIVCICEAVLNNNDEW